MLISDKEAALFLGESKGKSGSQPARSSSYYHDLTLQVLHIFPLHHRLASTPCNGYLQTTLGFTQLSGGFPLNTAVAARAPSSLSCSKASIELPAECGVSTTL